MVLLGGPCTHKTQNWKITMGSGVGNGQMGGHINYLMWEGAGSLALQIEHTEGLVHNTK